ARHSLPLVPAKAGTQPLALAAAEKTMELESLVALVATVGRPTYSIRRTAQIFRTVPASSATCAARLPAAAAACPTRRRGRYDRRRRRRCRGGAKCSSPHD